MEAITKTDHLLDPRNWYNAEFRLSRCCCCASSCYTVRRAAAVHNSNHRWAISALGDLNSSLSLQLCLAANGINTSHLKGMNKGGGGSALTPIPGTRDKELAERM